MFSKSDISNFRNITYITAGKQTIIYKARRKLTISGHLSIAILVIVHKFTGVILEFLAPVFFTWFFRFLLFSLLLAKFQFIFILFVTTEIKGCAIRFTLGIILLHFLTLSGSIFVELDSKVSGISGNLSLHVVTQFLVPNQYNKIGYFPPS